MNTGKVLVAIVGGAVLYGAIRASGTLSDRIAHLFDKSTAAPVPCRRDKYGRCIPERATPQQAAAATSGSFWSGLTSWWADIRPPNPDRDPEVVAETDGLVQDLGGDDCYRINLPFFGPVGSCSPRV